MDNSTSERSEHRNVHEANALAIQEHITPQQRMNAGVMTPDNVFRYWWDYGRCISCRMVCRHELHLFNHWRKYHAAREEKQRGGKVCL